MRAKGLNYASRSRMDNYIDRIKQKILLERCQKSNKVRLVIVLWYVRYIDGTQTDGENVRRL